MKLSEYTVSILIFVIGGIATVAAYKTAVNYEYQNAEQAILADNKAQIDRIEEHVDANLMILTALKSFYMASDNISRQEFKAFSEPLLQRNPDIQALEWVPKVTPKTRDDFRAKAIEEGVVGYVMKEPDHKNGGAVEAGKRDYYFPVYYVEPVEGNEKVLGLDFPKHTIRLEAIHKAIETGREASTAPVTLVQEKETQKGVLVFDTIYKDVPIEANKNDRMAGLQGLVLLVLRVSDTIGYVINNSPVKHRAEVYDVTNSKAGELLFKNFSKSTERDIRSTRDFDVAGRTWRVTIHTDMHNFHSLSYRLPILVLIIGASFTLFVTLITVQLTRGRQIISQLVDLRTKELTSTNAELEEFAYRTSHDLRSPLISAISLLDFAKDATEAGRVESAMEGIDHVKNSLLKLELLVQDILALTRVKNQEENLSLISLGELVDDALTKMDYLDGYERLSVRKNIELQKPVYIDKVRIRMIMENLISNAIKYQDPEEENPYIGISIYQEGDLLFMTFSDNGLGIPEDRRDDLFHMFKRFHARVSFGSGLGLYIINKAVTKLGGTISYEAQTKGSIFRVAVPLKKKATV